MKSKRNMRMLCLSIGDFIRYWGFRRIHGAIWARLYFEPGGLSVTDLARELGFTKALISSAIPQLLEYELIFKLPPDDDKSKVFVAHDDFVSTIKKVIAERETKMISNIRKKFDVFKEADDLDPDRVDRLENALSTVEFLLHLSQSSTEFLTPTMFQGVEGEA